MMTRRDAARGAAITALSYSRILGANDRIGLGVIGTGGRGTYVMGLFHKNCDVDVRAFCDVYPARFTRGAGAARPTHALSATIANCWNWRRWTRC